MAGIDTVLKNSLPSGKRKKQLFMLLFLIALIGTALISTQFSHPTQIVFFLSFLIFLVTIPILFSRPHYLLYIIIAIIPLGMFSLIMTHLTVLPILGGILVFIWILHYLLRKTTIPFVKEYKYILLLAFLITLSSFLGINISNSFWY